MYLCAVTIILVAIINMEITFINGFISEACLKGLKDFEQVRDAIILAKCEGLPFRGRPKDMARDVIAHVLKVLRSETGLFPVIIESFGGTDSKGEYTTKVVFQAVA